MRCHATRLHMMHQIKMMKLTVLFNYLNARYFYSVISCKIYWYAYSYIQRSPYLAQLSLTWTKEIGLIVPTLTPLVLNPVSNLISPCNTRQSRHADEITALDQWKGSQWCLSCWKGAESARQSFLWLSVFSDYLESQICEVKYRFFHSCLCWHW